MERKAPWRRWAPSVMLFLLLVTAFFYFIIMGSRIGYERELEKNGALWLTEDNTEYYPGKLYTQEEFVKGDLQAGDPDAHYGTRRAVVRLEPGKAYGLTGMTTTYAQRVYVDGVLLSETGKVSDNAEDFVPRTDYFTVYFTPQREQTELIFQYSWFNHQHGDFKEKLIAEQQIVVNYNRMQFLGNGLITGAFLAMALFFFGMFLYGKERRAFLWFAAACLCAGGHYLIYYSKDIMVIFPQLSWYVSHKLENVMHYSYYFLILLFAKEMMGSRIPKWTRVIFYTAYALLSGYYLIVPSVIYTRNIVLVGGIFTLVFLLLVGVLLYDFVRQKAYRQIDKVVICVSVLLTCGAWLAEALTYRGKSLYVQPYITLLFVFCNAVVLTVQFGRTQIQLQQIQKREREIAQENEMLERLNLLKNDFLHNIAHELKTPLTVMSGYAQLTSWKLQQKEISKETLDNLATIATEAERLSNLVTRLLGISYEKQMAGVAGKVEVAALLGETAAVCIPVMQKKGNDWKVRCEGNPSVSGNREMLLQVLINLVVNANKHTEKGKITVQVQKGEAGFLDFRIFDTGEGIAEEDIPHIFERGYSPDGGTGIGLAICKEILEAFGGRICVEQTGTRGTVFYFAVPEWEG